MEVRWRGILLCRDGMGVKLLSGAALAGLRRPKPERAGVSKHEAAIVQTARSACGEGG